MTTVFISYSREEINKTFARKLHAELSDTYGKEQAWMDWEDIPVTSDWWREICKGIETADSFVLVMSPAALISPMCHLEIYQARQLNKRIIPIQFQWFTADKLREPFLERIQKDSYAQSLMNTADYWQFAQDNLKYIGKINWLFFGEQDEFAPKFEELIRVIETDLPHVRQHTRLLLQALEWQENKHNWSFLLVGEEIQRAEAWMKRAAELLEYDEKQKYLPAPTILHEEYIVRSRQQATYRRRIYRGLAATLGTILGIAMMTSVYMVWSLSEAAKAQHTAEQAQRISQFSSGVAFYNVGEFQYARQYFEESLPKIENPQPKFYDDLAKSCLQLEDYACAETHYGHAIGLDEAYTPAYTGLAIMHRELNQFSDASAMLEKAKRVYASNGTQDILYPGGAYLIARIEGSLAFYQDDWQRTIAILTPLVGGETYVTYGKEVMFYLAASYQELGQSVQACPFWQQYFSLSLSQFALNEKDRDQQARAYYQSLHCE